MDKTDDRKGESAAVAVPEKTIASRRKKVPGKVAIASTIDTDTESSKVESKADAKVDATADAKVDAKADKKADKKQSRCKS